jgi:hypothetical protein
MGGRMSSDVAHVRNPTIPKWRTLVFSTKIFPVRSLLPAAPMFLSMNISQSQTVCIAFISISNNSEVSHTHVSTKLSSPSPCDVKSSSLLSTSKQIRTILCYHQEVTQYTVQISCIHTHAEYFSWVNILICLYQVTSLGIAECGGCMVRIPTLYFSLILGWKANYLDQ